VDFYEKQSEYERAEPFHQRALAIREKKLGAEHPETRIVPKNYTDLLQKIKAKREQHS